MRIRLFLGIIILLALVALPASAAWANDSYDSCVNVSIKNAGTTTLTWFPAYIEVPYQTGMKANFSDLAFYNAGCGVSGSRLASEQANYTPSGTAYTFVEIPTLNVGLTNISIMYNNNSPVDDVNRNHTKVWDPNFDAVYHLEEKGDATLRYDSTKDVGSTPVAVTAGDAAGKSASGLNLDGTDAYLNTDENTNISTAITAEIWFKSDDNSAPYHIIWQGPPAENGWGGGTSSEWHLSIGYTGGVGNELGAYYGTSTGASSVLIRRGGFTDVTNWQYAAFRISSMAGATATGNLWWNQTNITTDTGTEVTRTGMTTKVRLGRPGTASRFFNGIIDEFRLTINTTRSDNWLNNTYQQINSQGSFVSLAPAVSRPVVAWNSTPTAMNSPFLVNFVDKSTGNPALSSFTWDFNGDGVIDSVARNDTFTYSTPGTFSVNHSATNALGTRWLNRSNYIGVSATPNWYNENWINRTEIVIDHNKVQGNLTNFPILVSITNANLSSAQASGNDIVFTLSDGITKIPHEIENFTSPKLVAWVNVSSVSAIIDTPIYVYYGNPTADNQQDPRGVWDNNYIAVYHMNQDPSGIVLDSKGRHNLTSEGTMTTADLVMAKVDRGINFTRMIGFVSSDHLICQYAGTPGHQKATIQSFTLEGWGKSLNWNNWQGIIDIGSHTAPEDYRFFGALPGGYMGMDLAVGGAIDFRQLTNPLTNGVFYRGVGRYNSSTQFLNGTIDGAIAPYSYSGVNKPSLSGNISIGAWRDLASSAWYDVFEGVLDEVRVSNISRENEWLLTQYTNMETPLAFHYFGIEEKKIKPPVVIFNATPLFGNTTTGISFVDSSTGTNITQGNNFYWNLNDGNTSTLRNLSHVFPCTATVPGYCDYTINHSVTDSPGTPKAITNWSNQTNMIRVYVNSSPQFLFSGTPLSGTRPTSVSFTATPIGPINIDTWLWNFGDGNTSTSQNPSNLYSQAGQYTVTLTATNYTLGTTVETKTNYITVYNPAPTNIWSVSPPFGNTTTPLQFTDSSIGTNITQYYWIFNDGNTSIVQSPIHIFPVIGESYTYVINHSITDSPGTSWSQTVWLNKTGQVTIYKNASPLATFVADVTSVYTGDTVTFTPTLIGLIKPNIWHWNYGDGNTSDVADPPFVYNIAGLYNVSLTVTNYTLGTYDAIRDSYILVSNHAPIVDFNGTPTTVNLSSSVYFVDMSTGTKIDSWYWIFNDGNTSTAQNITHQFPQTGYYTINHSATDSTGQPWLRTNWTNKTDYIHVVNNSVTPSFTAFPTSGTRPLSVAFTDTSTGGSIMNRTWYFGDGNTSTAANPTFIYNIAGVYSVNYRVCNDAGCWWSNVSNYITVYNPAPTVSFTASPLFGNASTNIQFTDSSTGTNVTGWFWNFNDGNTSTTQNPLKKFPQTAADITYYTINHSATDSPGTPWAAIGWQNRTNYIAIYKNSSPTVTFSGVPTSGTRPLSVSFTATPAGAIRVDTWSWNFGDGNTSTSQNPSNLYSQAGQYTVTLTATNYTLGTTVETKTNYITVYNPAPVVDFYGTPTTVNLSTAVNFFDTTTGLNITGWYWIFNDGNTSTTQNPSKQFPQTGYYTINHSATDSAGTPWALTGWNNKTDYIHVINNSVTPSFTAFPTSGTRPLSVAFTDTSTGGSIMNRTWYFGDGNTSTAANPTFIYNIAGVYSVNYRVCNDAGCWWSNVSNYITVKNPAPVPDWSATPTVGNITTPITFTDLSTGSNLTAWYWFFNDGNTSTTQNPVHTFPNLGYYTINFSVTDSAGTPWAVMEWLNRTNYIHIVNLTPHAAFTGSPNIGDTPLDVQFADISTGPIVIRYWDFGDGSQYNTTDTLFFHHVYLVDGIYTVNLTVCNFEGICDSEVKINYVTVQYTPINASFVAVVDNGLVPLNVTFIDTSIGHPITWNWSFGEGNYSDFQHPTYLYTTPGNYTVTLIASKPNSTSTYTRSDYVHVYAPIVKPSFTATPVSGNQPLTVYFTDVSTGYPIFPNVWNWSFGDGNYSNDQNPVHIYVSPGNYTVSLTASNGYAQDTLTKTNYIVVSSVAGPTAQFVGQPTTGIEPLTVTFTDLSSGGPTAWNWSFGDGTFNTTQNPVHVYTWNGTYSVTLNVTNAYGVSESTKTDYIVVSPIVITPTPTPTPAPILIAALVGVPVSGNAPLNVTFNDASWGYPYPPDSWNWSFGDGNYSNEQNPVYSYGSTGIYTVGLTVSNAYLTNTTTRTNYIIVSEFNVTPTPTQAPLLIAALVGVPVSGYGPLRVTFNDASSGYPYPPNAWNWSFGDGNFSNDQNPVYIYGSAGTYTVSLTIANAYTSNTTTRPDYITVYGAVTADFFGSPISGATPLTVTFTDLSGGWPVAPTAWNWSFGDGNYSTAQNPTHVYVSPGIYTVSLNASTLDAFNIKTIYNYIFASSALAPTSSFIGQPNMGIEPLMVAFTDLSTGSPTAWNWSFGDGTFSDARNPNHVYTWNGTYTVSLNVTNGYGYSESTRMNYILVLPPGVTPTPTITPVPGLPRCNFNGTPIGGTAPLDVAFVDMSDAISPTGWTWDFENDGIVDSTNRDDSFTYTSQGSYSIKHTVTNASGTGVYYAYNYIVVYPATLLAWDSGETWISWKWNPVMLHGFGSAALYADDQFVMNFAGDVMNQSMPEKYIMSDLNPSEGHTFVIYSGEHINETCCEGPVIAEMQGHTQPPLVLNLLLFLVASILLVFAWVSEGCQNKILACIVEIIIMVYAMMLLYNYMWMALIPFMYIAAGGLMIVLCLYDLWRQNINWT